MRNLYPFSLNFSSDILVRLEKLTELILWENEELARRIQILEKTVSSWILLSCFSYLSLSLVMTAIKYLLFARLDMKKM